MTLTMQDSIDVANLTPGADAYLGYTDGRWATWPALQARFGASGAHLLSMAVFADGDAEGCDCEAGDLTPSQVPGWVKRQQARGVHRPVVYASASKMPAVLTTLALAGVQRSGVRLLSAHYGAGKHICGPATCAYPGVTACDGTQWTDSASGTGGAHIDESVLLGDFFDGGTMAITDADAAKIAKAVWTVDGVVPNPADPADKANPYWEPQRVLSVIGGQVLGGPAAIVAGVLKGLAPATMAEAIATAVGPEIGQEVVDALQARLAGKATS